MKQSERILFVTGRLAEFSLRKMLKSVARQNNFEYEIQVLGISVAALMHPGFVLRKLQLAKSYNRVLLPGWCQGDLASLSNHFQVPFELGPKCLHDLPEFFQGVNQPKPELNRYDIEILAEINHAPRLSDREILRIANSYRDSGADVIDVGCVPGEPWSRAGQVTRLLRHEGHRVSIDSFERSEVEAAVEQECELVLSCNSTNVGWAANLNVELVVIPDDPRKLQTWDGTREILEEKGVRYRVDPVLEPIGFGFAASLERYFAVRSADPSVDIMMGVGNLTELTAVDSAGLNFLLAGICQELGIRSVLTTEVINWCRSAVSELDFARRLVHDSISNHRLPKHHDDRLVLLRDPKLTELGEKSMSQFLSQLSDPNPRLFVERGELHLCSRDGYWHGTDPYEVFDRFVEECGPLETSHAFYLGYELSKATTALTLGKRYRQDESLTWGFLTRSEQSARERRKREQHSQSSEQDVHR